MFVCQNRTVNCLVIKHNIFVNATNNVCQNDTQKAPFNRGLIFKNFQLINRRSLCFVW